MEQNILSVNGKLLVVENSLIVPRINLQEKEVIPSDKIQVIKSDDEYTGLKQVTIEAIPTTTRANTTITSTADDTNDKLTFTASNNQSTGYVTGSNETATKTVTLTASGANVTASDGTNSISKSVATATQAAPSITINSNGLVTASATQTAGYVTAGTKSATKQLTVQAAQTITPGTSNKTIASGRYLTGTQTIKGDSNLIAANIKSGISIFGVSGSYAGATTTTAYAAIGVEYPQGSTCTCTNGSITYTAPDTNGFCTFIIPSNGTWVVSSPAGSSESVSITKGGQTANINLVTVLTLLKGTDKCTSVTGGWSTANASCEYAEGYSAPGVGYSSSGVTLSFPKGQDSIMGSALSTVNTIDLTNWDTLSWDYSGNDMARIAIYPSFPSGFFSATAKANATTKSLKVTSLNGQYHIIICASNGWGSVQSGTVNNIQLKRT